MMAALGADLAAEQPGLSFAGPLRLSNYWWGWVFLMNLPVVAVGLAVVEALVPESRVGELPGFDPVGMLTSCLGLAR